jgi:transposase-like protein
MPRGTKPDLERRFAALCAFDAGKDYRAVAAAHGIGLSTARLWRSQGWERLRDLAIAHDNQTMLAKLSWRE